MIRVNPAFIFGAAASTLLAACATVSGPAEVSGEVKPQPNLVVSAARIYEIDGVTIHQSVAPLQSGRHTIRLQALPQNGFRGGELKDITLDVKPCTRYFLGVKRESERHFDWEPMVVAQEPIAGCTPKS